MNPLRYLALICILAVAAGAAPLKDNIKIEAMIVTKAELRRHMSAQEDDHFKPATYADLQASSEHASGDSKQPDYLVVRFLTVVLGHYSGEAEAKIDGSIHGTRINVVLHFNKGWVEYFIPLDGLAWSPFKKGSPTVSVTWNKLTTE